MSNSQNKNQRNSVKKKIGRPSKREQTNRKIAAAVTKLRPEVVKKLEEAFSIDATIEEACFYADISRETYYQWIRKNKELADRFAALRNKPVLKARTTVVKELGSSYQNAMDYLKRKKKLEFGDSNRTEVTGKDGEPIKIKWEK